VQRPRVAADEEAAARDEGPELRQVELADVEHLGGAGGPEPRARRRGDPAGRRPVGRARAQHETAVRRTVSQSRDDLGERDLRPSPEGVVRADVHHHELGLGRRPR
jgi:hypothetical protein